MKKLFSLLTALALSLALALSVAAAGTPTIVAKADNDALKRGDTFYVTVSLDNNPGICLMQVAVVFDEKVFEFVDVENGTLITSSLYAPDRVSGAKLDWEPGKDIFGDGKLAWSSKCVTMPSSARAQSTSTPCRSLPTTILWSKSTGRAVNRLS